VTSRLKGRLFLTAICRGCTNFLAKDAEKILLQFMSLTYTKRPVQLKMDQKRLKTWKISTTAPFASTPQTGEGFD
jgi:hypothetical protein